MDRPTTLLVPEKSDAEFEQVIKTWLQKGGHVKQLGKYWIKDDSLTRAPIAIYGNQTFALVLAQIYNVELISPDDTLIARLDTKWTKRNIEIKTIGQIADIHFPIFIKPVIPKLFLAGIFHTAEDFRQVTNGLKQDEQLLISSIITPIQAEARCFVKDGEIKDVALYEGSENIISLANAQTFLTRFIEQHKQLFPHVVVIDLAYNNQTGWFVLEFNACWGAGLNNCKAENVIDCIIGATVTIPSSGF
jgi:hypothetical protein